jgi:lipid-A-disaccharide synthase
MTCDLFILAGEPSGDLHGAALIKQLLHLNPALKIHAVAGPRMREYPIHSIEKMENLTVMGFIDIIAALPKIARTFFALRHKILELSPKAVITIDYPGFNLRLHRSLSRKKYPGKQIHYICPTVWAWGKKRIELMARNLDLGLAILPFEPACFAKTPLKMQYVGHPLTKAIANHKSNPLFRSKYGFLPSDKILALFPGSRQKEIEQNLPLMLKAASLLQTEDPSLRLAISGSQIPLNDTYDLMQNAHLALAKSGTVILELALHKTPTVVQYAIKPLDVFLATKVFKINLPYYSLANLILQEEAFPELFGPNLTDKSLQRVAKNLWFDEEKRTASKKSCEKLWGVLGSEDARLNAAHKILETVFD